MSTYQVIISDDELGLMQQDIINDFLKIEDNIKLDVNILAAKLSLIIKFMKCTRHKNLRDFEYIYKRIKTSKLEPLPSNEDSLENENLKH